MIRRRNPRFYKKELKDIFKLIFKGEVAKGEYIKLFEEKFAQYIGARFVIATCSGRNGLDLLLDAFELEKGDEIIMPAYTLKDLIYLIERKELVVKLVDIEKDSFNINPDLIKAQISSKTRVIIATHFFGLPCNIEKILEIAKKYNLRVIEDCAHALGANFKNKKVGSIADAAFFSFEVLKSVNAFGGGAITTNDKDIAKAVRDKVRQYPYSSKKILSKILFNYIEDFIIRGPLFPALMFLFMSKGTTKTTSWFYLFLHRQARAEYARFTNIQALMGLRQLNTLDEKNKKRNIIAQRLADKLNENIFLQKSPFSEGRIFYFFVVKLPIHRDIDIIRNKLLRYGIDVGIKEEITDNCAQVLNQTKDYPAVERLFNSNLQLPMYDSLKEKDINTVSFVLNKIFPSIC